MKGRGACVRALEGRRPVQAGRPPAGRTSSLGARRSALGARRSALGARRSAPIIPRLSTPATKRTFDVMTCSSIHRQSMRRGRNLNRIRLRIQDCPGRASGPVRKSRCGSPGGGDRSGPSRARWRWRRCRSRRGFAADARPRRGELPERAHAAVAGQPRRGRDRRMARQAVGRHDFIPPRPWPQAIRPDF